MKVTLQKSLSIVCLSFIVFVFSLCKNNKPFNIVPIEGDNIVFHPDRDSVSSVVGRFDDFIVEGNFNEKEVRSVLDKYAQEYADSLVNEYETYGMSFYIESDDINVKDIKATEMQYRSEIFAHAKPFYSIRWLNGERIQ